MYPKCFLAPIVLLLAALCAPLLCALTVSATGSSAQTLAQNWDGDADLSDTDFPTAYQLEIEGEEREGQGIEWFVDTADIYLSVSNHKGRVVVGGPRLSVASGTSGILRPDGTSGSVLVPLVLDRRSAEPGMYTLRVVLRAQLRDRMSGTSGRSERLSAVYVLYLPPRPDNEPTLTPGQRFIALPWLNDHLTEPTSFRDVSTGNVLKWDAIRGNVFTLHSVEQVQGRRRYVFALEDQPAKVYVEGNFGVQSLPHLTPLVTDSTVRDLKAKYEGRKVWSPRSAGGVCILSRPNVRCEMTGPITTPIVIERIERLHMDREYLGFGGGSNDPHSTGDAGFLTSNPLVVLLDVPAKGLEVGFCSWSATELTEGEAEDWHDEFRENPRKYCTKLWYEVSDKWDFERRYSLQPPWEAHPEWPKRMRDAVREGHLELGMTPEMVVWVWGWPSIYGSIEDLTRITAWEYAGLPAKSDYLHFRNGQLVGVDPYVSP